MRRIKAGHTLWTFNMVGQIISFLVVTSRYNDHRGITVLGWPNDSPRVDKPVEITINRFGFVVWNDMEFKEFATPTKECWTMARWSRRSITHAAKRGKVGIVFPEKESFLYRLKAESKGMRLWLVPFFKRDVHKRQVSFMEKLFMESQAAAPSDDRKFRVVLSDNSYKVEQHE